MSASAQTTSFNRKDHPEKGGLRLFIAVFLIATAGMGAADTDGTFFLLAKDEEDHQRQYKNKDT